MPDNLIQPFANYDTFVGDGQRRCSGSTCAGNRHALFTVGETFELACIREWSRLNPNIIACAISPSDSFSPARGFFYRDGSEIQFCGSGLLAIAAVLVKKTNVDLLSRFGRITLIRRGDLYGFVSYVKPLKPLSQKRMWQTIVGASNICGANVGGNSDYAIIQLENGRKVNNCYPNVKLMKILTRRALIVTAQSGTPRHYVMRYFAPQYGQIEDAATGSANAHLIRYWSSKVQPGQWYGHQLSAQGGWFSGVATGSRVQLTGYVKQMNVQCKAGFSELAPVPRAPVG